jgi:hypothetical protein
MNLGAPVDLYCERLAPGLFAEPLNAVSNLAFMGTSLWLLARLRRQPDTPWYAYTLAALIFVVGLGSLAFHTFAQAWAEILDVGCIALFIYFYVACFCRHFLRASWPLALLAIPAYLGFSFGLTKLFPPAALNGSVDYLPALAGLLMMAMMLRLRRDPAAVWLGFAACVFLVSLGFRTYDLAWCERFPPGTHWIWHSLNALTLSLVCLSLGPVPRVVNFRGVRS